jgi:hypothetical protein
MSLARGLNMLIVSRSSEFRRRAIVALLLLKRYGSSYEQTAAWIVVEWNFQELAGT